MLALVLYLPFLLVFAILGIYVERKVSAWMQDRMGPVNVGPRGLLQTFADILKLLTKEDIIPKAVDRTIFKYAPIVIFMPVFAGFAVLPFTNGIYGSQSMIGVFYILAILSLEVLGIIAAGWSSNNKYALYGAMRSASQMVSYEVPMGLAVLCVVMTAQTLNTEIISTQQGLLSADVNYLFGLKSLGIDVTDMGGILTWNILRNPFLILAFIIFYISSLAEANRAPFDLPEAETELIAGYHIEYSGMRFAFMMLAEYGVMLLGCVFASVLFLGSWNTPFINIGSLRLADWTTGTTGELSGYVWGFVWLMSKTLFLVFVQMWIRWSYPRLRVDQLMTLCWKYLTPAGLLLVFITGVWRLMMI
ncbi:NADH-quinone oxidoreductase subunit H [Flammeovirga yaeyamensis]|uniref:NADH-quinone oxidoreductase subunit H n=1 Tax=Flammeovirga yaeyamensis TaxID=367791 RepID=A0AAX1N427_9BACT|nr:complex I subunit 1 family protein [Flammeovirga yaeyamensis]MBB3700910.1 NADH-quinone oxidoreductase subunit H [Flammeovirga yaeyamensis]NMF38018.1 NADH-quinone oxidoreductase subunit H [Flammeovirga yaeyamensis]QWG00668.1 NADH-quinone oxidoreductase subunit H [Flammeovirga yaeyamensis]